jgi:hypothetical protein
MKGRRVFGMSGMTVREYMAGEDVSGSPDSVKFFQDIKSHLKNFPEKKIIRILAGSGKKNIYLPIPMLIV